MTPARFNTVFATFTRRGFPSLIAEPLNNHVIVGLGKAATGHKISMYVPMTVVKLSPIVICSCFSPLIAIIFSPELVIFGALPSFQRIKK